MTLLAGWSFNDQNQIKHYTTELKVDGETVHNSTVTGTSTVCRFKQRAASTYTITINATNHCEDHSMYQKTFQGKQSPSRSKKCMQNYSYSVNIMCILP